MEAIIARGRFPLMARPAPDAQRMRIEIERDAPRLAGPKRDTLPSGEAARPESLRAGAAQINLRDLRCRTRSRIV